MTTLITKLIAMLLLGIVSFGLGMAVMVYGWGLQPQSWGWIIGGTIANTAIVTLITIVGKAK